MSKNLTHLSGRKGLDNSLFEQISQAERTDGESLRQLAEEYLMGPAVVYGTASFYDFTRPENQNKKVQVCNGTACMLAGTQSSLKERLKGYFGEEDIGEMCCLGRCHENGAFQYNGQNYSDIKPERLEVIFAGNDIHHTDLYAVSAVGSAILTSTFPPLEELQIQLKSILQRGARALLQEVKTSGLRGRGGAGFPIAVKMETCLEAEAAQKFIVCNADEGDPGSYSDRYLLEQQPHAVLIGMLLAGYITGAPRGVIYLRSEYPESLVALEQAIEHLHKVGLAGENILDTGFDFQFKIILGQGAYICGEETALLASIEGLRPEVRIRPPYPVTEGLFGKPTLINNVETLANLYPVLKKGGQTFAAIGRKMSSGTKLLSLDSFFNVPGVYEVEMGTPLSVVVNELGRGFREPVKALHIGGPLGGLVPIGKIDELTIDFESFARAGFLLGHASIVAIPEAYPMIKYLEHLFAFTAHESCGKCFPCRLGSVRGKELLQQAQKQDYQIDTNLFTDLLDTLEKGSLCGLGGGMPLPVRNAMKYFKTELQPYFR